METPTLLIESMISVTASNLALISAWSSSGWVTCKNKEKSCQTTYSTWYHNKFSLETVANAAKKIYDNLFLSEDILGKQQG
jgi:hypothetical protein